jgi:hypothetical protein
MRKITEEAAKAFRIGKNYKSGNTRVELVDYECRMYLFGNLIIKRIFNDTYVTIAGHQTNTTLERLSAFIPVRVKKGEMFVNNKPWDGSWTNILEFENG